jgi:hypothetical protein
VSKRSSWEESQYTKHFKEGAERAQDGCDSPHSVGETIFGVLEVLGITDHKEAAQAREEGYRAAIASGSAKK